MHFSEEPFKLYIPVAIISYVLGKYTFERVLTGNELQSLNYYNEIELYSVIYESFISILFGNTNLEIIGRDYLDYIRKNTRTFYGQDILSIEISFLLAKIFIKSKGLFKNKCNLLKRVIDYSDKIDVLTIYQTLLLNDIKAYENVINIEEIYRIENEILKEAKNYEKLVKSYFQLSQLYSGINSRKSIFFLQKGIIDSTLRHGYHKDYIVSIILTECLKILISNNWIFGDILKSLVNDVLALTIKVIEITDGDHTNDGPFNVIDILAENNINLAEQFLDNIPDENKYRIHLDSIIYSIIFNKVKQGYLVNDIEDDFIKYSSAFNHGDLIDRKLSIHINIANSDLYSDREREEQFEIAYNIINQDKNELKEFLSKDSFKNEKLIYKTLCEKYGKPLNIDEELIIGSKTKTEFNESTNKVKLKDFDLKIDSINQVLGKVLNREDIVNLDDWVDISHKGYHPFR